MLRIDGAQGEGGGQVLRTALALSLATGTPFAIDGVRGGRANAGLQRQHLACVQAATEVGDATVDGARVGATALTFAPRALRAGEYRFAVGTAGSTTLVLQTILPALLRAGAPSTVLIAGGTHNPMAPPFEFVARALAPVLQRMGARLEVQLVRHGFWPAGGGSMTARIDPVERLLPLELLRREAGGLLRARALLSRLPDDIGRRQLVELVQRFGRNRLHVEQTTVERFEVDGPGNALMLELPAQSHCEIVTAFGERGVRAEQVADIVATEALALLACDVPVGPHLADQLLVPMALAGGGTFRTVEPTLHTTTTAAVVERFLPVRFAMREEAARSGRWVVECGPTGG